MLTNYATKETKYQFGHYIIYARRENRDVSDMSFENSHTLSLFVLVLVLGIWTLGYAKINMVRNCRR